MRTDTESGPVGRSGKLLDKKCGAIVFLVICVLVLLPIAAYYGVKYTDLKNEQDFTSSDMETITILQINDCYEMLPVSGKGGLPRVATIRKQLAKENPNIITLLAGDLWSPSALSTATVNITNGPQNVKLSGRQMQDVMNEIPLDYATLGNHEFDLKLADFSARLSESKTQWLACNARNASNNNQSYAGVLDYAVHTFGSIRLGIIGVASPYNNPAYSSIAPLTQSIDIVKTLIAEHGHEWDAAIAITHYLVADDATFATGVQNLTLVIGGHEHENWFIQRGQNAPTPDGFVTITKADANSKSVYIHKLVFNKNTKKLVHMANDLKVIDDSVADDPAILNRSNYWTNLAFDGFRAQGFEPTAEVTVLPIALDGREASVRTGSTQLTEDIVSSFVLNFPEADLCIMNSGGIRIDDVLQPGPITQYDIIRVLPFGNYLQLARIDGDVLVQILDQGLANINLGGYLQTTNVTKIDGTWRYVPTGAAIDPSAKYLVATLDYLLNGLETNLGFMKAGSPGVELVNSTITDLADMRKCFIVQLQKLYGMPTMAAQSVHTIPGLQVASMEAIM